MARSQDDPLYGDIQQHWNYGPDSTTETCNSKAMSDRQQQSLATNAGMLNENNMFVKPNSFTKNDVYMNNHPFNISGEHNIISDDGMPFNNMPQSVNRVNNLQNYGALNIGNGQLVRVYYDENNRQFMIPVSNQYEHFNNPGLREPPTQNAQPPHIFPLNQEYSVNNNVRTPQPPPGHNSNFCNDHLNMQNSNVPTSSFLNEVLGNWAPNSSGTYSPFGQNYPLNHPDAPTMNIHQTSNPLLDTIASSIQKHEIIPPKRNENSPLADTSNKKRIVAEVKPMRPSYSDVLAKNTKNNIPVDNPRKTKNTTQIDSKTTNKTVANKLDKQSMNNKQNNEVNNNKSDKITKQQSTISSGSESGDITLDEIDKQQKPAKKNRNKRSNISRKWSSLDDITNEEDSNIADNNSSQFVFIENQMDKKKEKRTQENKLKQSKKNSNEEEFNLDDEDQSSQFLDQDGQAESVKSKKKKEARNYSYKLGKTNQDKKKTQTKWRRNKPGYLGMAQNYMEHWGGATWKAAVWFLYLLSDICRMSAHLSFDLCTSIFTQTYMSSQAVWRSTKDWLYKLKDNKYLLYIDTKLGHTKFGFWRKLKWFKKDSDLDNGNQSNKLNANIPLPATGEEAMKRLLACKGKDPYSILGVSVTCTDEDIKRYYRRQAFLVHPDKNQQPGAEEAFKILQHAFDLIGEPERREQYTRRAQESRHAEAAWSELSVLLAQLHNKMEVAANTIRCTNCGRRHKRVATERPCYAARYCAQCKIRHSAKEGDIWAESSMMGLLVMYYACMDGAVYQITQWASCQKKNLKQLRADCHVVQYRIVLGSKAGAAPDLSHKPAPSGHEPNLEEFLNNLYSKSGPPPAPTASPSPSPSGPSPAAPSSATDAADAKVKRRTKKSKP